MAVCGLIGRFDTSTAETSASDDNKQPNQAKITPIPLRWKGSAFGPGKTFTALECTSDDILIVATHTHTVQSHDPTHPTYCIWSVDPVTGVMELLAGCGGDEAAASAEPESTKTAAESGDAMGTALHDPIAVTLSRDERVLYIHR